MKFKVIATKNQTPSCIGFDDNHLYISSKEKHNYFEQLQATAYSFRKSGSNGYTTIDLKKIKEIKLHGNSAEFFIRYKANINKLKKHYLSIADKEIRELFCEGLAKECLLISKSTFKNPYARLPANLIIISLIIILTIVLRIVSIKGLDGYNRPLRRAVAEIIEMIGPNIITGIGALISAYFLFKIIKNFIQPTLTIIYKN